MIQWYPGHMAKNFKDIQRISQIMDLFIVVLDGRAPLSSYNHDFDKIAPQKPRLFIITKSDLSDYSKLQKIQKKFNHKQDRCLVADLKKRKSLLIIKKSINEILKEKKNINIKKGLQKNLRMKAIVVGIPNSGKSTLINLIAMEKKTKVGNEPGITKGKQWIETKDLFILDTPGILWPKFEDELVAIKLAIIGSIKLSVLSLEEIFYGGYKLLSSYYPMHIKKLEINPAKEKEKIYNELYKMCQYKKILFKKNQPDFKKGMHFFLKYLKNLKGITFE